MSSNMAASIATEIKIHLCKHLLTLLCQTVSPWTSPFVVQALYDYVCAWCVWLPRISRWVCAIWRHVGGQHDVSENALLQYNFLKKGGGLQMILTLASIISIALACMFHNHKLYGWIYFTWPLRKQAAYKQAIRGPMALSPFWGTRQWGLVPCQGHYCCCQQTWTGDLMVESLWSYPLSHDSSSCLNFEIISPWSDTTTKGGYTR